MSGGLLLLSAAAGCGHRADPPPVTPSYDVWPLHVFTTCPPSSTPVLADDARLFLEVKAGDEVVLRTWSPEAGTALCSGTHGFGMQVNDGPLGSPVLKVCSVPPGGPLTIRICVPGAAEQTWTREPQRIADSLKITNACGTPLATTTFSGFPVEYSVTGAPANTCPRPGDLLEVHVPHCPCERQAT